MDIKKALLILLIAFAVLVSASAVNAAGLFDEISGESQDNVIEIENITFNTTNVTKFQKYNESDGWKYYTDENNTGYNVHIYNFNEVSASQADADKADINEKRNSPCQTVNGIVVYTITADSGEHVGEPRYWSFVENKDLNTIITLSSPDPNETAKMASTLKFK